MISKNKIKYIHALELKKNRKESGLFVAEGHKLVEVLLNKFSCILLVATPYWLSKNPIIQAKEIIEVSEEELAKVSFQKHPQEVLAIFEQPTYTYDAEIIRNSLSLALDGVQDPGNLGTIIRLADWFGIDNIFCSLNTVEVYNPKTIQATMGAIARVKVHYCSLPQLITELNGIPIYGTFLDGKNIYKEKLSENGLIIMGNEGNGITTEIESIINNRLYIPNFPIGRETSESLNVAMATGIICSEFRRKTLF